MIKGRCKTNLGARSVQVRCQTCGAPVKKWPSEVNRARREGRRLFCDKDCAGIARRTVDTRTDAEKKADKREYDKVYRAKNLQRIKRLKAMRYQRDRDPEKEREKRQARMSWHVAYCRRYYSDPKRKAEKIEYDAERRSRLQYGYWAECHRLYVELCREIRRRMPNKYEAWREGGTAVGEGRPKVSGRGALMFALPRGISKVGLVIENQRRMHFELARVAVNGDVAALREALKLWRVLPKGGVRQ